MPRVRFTANYTVQAPGGRTFKKGEETWLTASGVEHFRRKGIIEDLPVPGFDEPGDPGDDDLAEEPVKPRAKGKGKSKAKRSEGTADGGSDPGDTASSGTDFAGDGEAPPEG